jgi:ribosomal protein S2
MRAAQAQVHRLRNRGSLGERAEGGMLEREREGEVLVVGHRKAVQRNCVAEVEGIAMSWMTKRTFGNVIENWHLLLRLRM